MLSPKQLRNHYAAIDHYNRNKDAIEAFHAERRAKHAEQAAISKHIGEVGETVTLALKRVTTVQGPFSLGHKMVDDQGNALIYWSRAAVVNRLTYDDYTVVTAQVKAHNEHNGLKETAITRVKLA